MMKAKDMLSNAWKIFVTIAMLILVVIAKAMFITVEFWPFMSIAFIMSFLAGLLSPTVGWILCGIAWAFVLLKALVETEYMLKKS